MIKRLRSLFLPKPILKKENVNYPENINFEKRYIFIHIPKNAGTSVIKGLHLNETSHHTADELRDLCGKDFNLFYSFCFVRNPWDRFLSLYNYARLEESYYHSAINPEKALFGKHRDYDLLKNATLKECAYYLLDNKLTHPSSLSRIHWDPQHKWIFDNQGNNIVNYIGKIEDYNHHIKILNKKLGIRIQEHKINVSMVKHDYRDYYDAETKEIIGNFYKKDIQLFDYVF